MLHNCYSLLSFPKLNWNISNVQDMSFMFHNFPLYLINFQWNFLPYQNTNHMFTNFDNYTSSNERINVMIDIPNDKKLIIVVYNDVLVEDLIDKWFWKLHFIDYNSDGLEFIFNNQKLNKNKTLLENGVKNSSNIIKAIIPKNLIGGYRNKLY